MRYLRFILVPLLLAACHDQPTALDGTVALHRRHAPSDAARPARIISFGDSHSDLGNLHLATGGFLAGPPYFEGRWTNGPNWLEELAARLRVPAVTASLAGGTGYAWGGAETGSGTVAGFIPNVGAQIDLFLSQDALAGDELLVVWAGTNDGLQNVLSGGAAGSEPETAVMQISEHIRSLAAAGGRHFLVPDLHSLGLAPFFAGTPNADGANAWTRAFNELLEEELEVLEDDLGIRILHLEVSELIDELVDHPKHFGLTNVTDQACDGCFENFGGTPVPNPDDYLWWDAVHFTRVVHRILGVMATKLVLDDDDDDDDDQGDNDEG